MASRPPQQAPLQRGWHCVHDLHYHCVFVVKYRRSLLDPEVVTHLTPISQEIEERYDFAIECLGADVDHVHFNHVHLLCHAPPAMAPADIVRIYKSITARELFQCLPRLKKELWGGSFWSGGCFVSTVGQRGGWAAITRYVRQQG